jgi:hypothetical protein
MRSYSPVKEFTGRLITKDPVMVVPQVSGMLIRRTFTDGERVIGSIRLFGIVVRSGTLLFEIEKVQFEADLKKAKADIAKAEADIKNWQAQIRLADAEFARVDQAFKNTVASKTDLDKAAATVDVSKAQLDVARANREAAIAADSKAAENLRYCSICAPTSGLVRQAKVAERSIVDAYKTELVEVSPIDPIYALFDIDELTSLWYRSEIYEKKTIPVILRHRFGSGSRLRTAGPSLRSINRVKRWSSSIQKSSAEPARGRFVPHSRTRAGYSPAVIPFWSAPAPGRRAKCSRYRRPPSSRNNASATSMWSLRLPMAIRPNFAKSSRVNRSAVSSSSRKD